MDLCSHATAVLMGMNRLAPIIIESIINVY